MRSSTPFNPEQTNANLVCENIDDMATCSTNRFAIEMEDSTALTCDQFDDYGCQSKNDDLTPILTESNGGCGTTKEFPTGFPTSLEDLGLIPSEPLSNGMCCFINHYGGVMNHFINILLFFFI